MHEIIVAWKFYFHAWKYEISMHWNDIFMHKNGKVATGIIFLAPETFMGNWAVHYFMHEILIHECFGAGVSFSCMDISLACMKYPCHNFFMHETLHTEQSTTVLPGVYHWPVVRQWKGNINPFTLRVSQESVVCYSHTFENIFWIKQKFTKDLKESSCLACEHYFAFKCFQENVFVS